MTNPPPIELQLKRLHRSEAELVRCWRNSPEVRRHMMFRAEITVEQQQRWFDSIDNDCNYYFLIHRRGCPIGLVNLKDVDRSAGSSEAGIFFGEPEDGERSVIAYATVFALMDFAFEQLKLHELKAHVLPDNRWAIRFNQSLGYERDSNAEDKYLYRVTPARHREVSRPLRKAIGESVRVTVEP